MKIHVEFNSIAEMVNFSKFAGNDLVQVPVQAPKRDKNLPLGASSWEDAYKRTNANLERAYERLRMLDPKKITVGKEAEGFVKEEYINLDDGYCPVTLPVRAINALKGVNVLTLQDLLKKTESDLMWGTPGISKVSVTQIKEALASKGYKLAKGKK